MNTGPVNESSEQRPGATLAADHSGVDPRQAQRAEEAFLRLHGQRPAARWSAPGRVNLIGEHTDYNDGFVLPFALPHRVAVAASPRTDGVLAVTTLLDDGRSNPADPVPVAELAPGRVSGWAAYPAGVAWVLRQQGIPVDGATVVIAGDVPAGAGLSSSHALECAMALTLLDLAGHPVGSGSALAPDRTALAGWIQRAENDFVGAPTGLLDQTASLRCTAGHALFLDVRSGQAEQVPFDAAAAGLEVLVVDTRASHSNSDGGYAQRRRGCEEAAGLLGVAALRDVEPSGLDAALARLPERLRPLVRHIVTENARVLDVVGELKAGRMAAIGPVLTAGHASLRDDYRISCLELDTAVDAAMAAGALGARMIGGGFGGSAIALVRTEDAAAVRSAVTAAFAARSLLTPRLFSAVPAAGASQDA